MTRTGLRPLALGLALGAGVAGLAAADVVKLGVLAPLTGPAAADGQKYVNGVQLAVDELNAEGGVAGHTFELVGRRREGPERGCGGHRRGAAAGRPRHGRDLHRLRLRLQLRDRAHGRDGHALPDRRQFGPDAGHHRALARGLPDGVVLHPVLRRLQHRDRAGDRGSGVLGRAGPAGEDGGDHHLRQPLFQDHRRRHGRELRGRRLGGHRLRHRPLRRGQRLAQLPRAGAAEPAGRADQHRLPAGQRRHLHDPVHGGPDRQPGLHPVRPLGARVPGADQGGLQRAWSTTCSAAR